MFRNTGDTYSGGSTETARCAKKEFTSQELPPSAIVTIDGRDYTLTPVDTEPPLRQEEEEDKSTAVTVQVIASIDHTGHECPGKHGPRGELLVRIGSYSCYLCTNLGEDGTIAGFDAHFPRNGTAQEDWHLMPPGAVIQFPDTPHISSDALALAFGELRIEDIPRMPTAPEYRKLCEHLRVVLEEELERDENGNVNTDGKGYQVTPAATLLNRLEREPLTLAVMPQNKTN